MSNNALQKIESHEKLCRIMQKQTHDKMHQLENQITRVERILLVRDLQKHLLKKN